MCNNKRVRGGWWACAVFVVLLAAGCVSAASEESGGSVPVSDDGGVGGVASGLVPSSLGSLLSPPTGGVTTTTTSITTTSVVQVGEGNGGGEPVGGVVSAEVRVSEEGLERLRRVLGEDKFAGVLEAAERLDDPELAELYGMDSGVLLGRLAGEIGFLTEEGLGKLAERRSGRGLARAARDYSEGELAEYVNEGEEWMVGPWGNVVPGFDGRFADEYSDEEVKAFAFYKRADAEVDNRLWDDNDLSTPVGAFCWAVLRVRHIAWWTRGGTGIMGGGFRPWTSSNLRVWHLEREAEERGIELEWETPPLDADLVVRRGLLEATAPEIRSVVFAPGLPSVLRPAAEAVYSVYDELLALPVRRVRPTVEELSAYDRLRDLTEEEIAQIWSEEFEIDSRDEDEVKYWNAMRMLRDGEVSELLNAECKERPLEHHCPPWELTYTDLLLTLQCDDTAKATIEILSLYSSFCPPPLFSYADNYEAWLDQEECTVDEETAERIRELERELERLRWDR